MERSLFTRELPNAEPQRRVPNGFPNCPSRVHDENYDFIVYHLLLGFREVGATDEYSAPLLPTSITGI
jgi:hypothetical protein